MELPIIRESVYLKEVGMFVERLEKPFVVSDTEYNFMVITDAQNVIATFIDPYDFTLVRNGKFLNLAELIKKHKPSMLCN